MRCFATAVGPVALSSSPAAAAASAAAESSPPPPAFSSPASSSAAPAGTAAAAAAAGFGLWVFFSATALSGNACRLIAVRACAVTQAGVWSLARE